ncbi:putative ATP-dependent RNA helicase [Cladorrhinum sp. PSN332]|nr:putative ATP-dependent RNA helicase [Cladorrhinum sp. PSN332]
MAAGDPKTVVAHRSKANKSKNPKDLPKKSEAKTLKRKRGQDELERLRAAIKDLDPKSAEITKFTDLPLCEATASGLRASHFEALTDVQRVAIPLALKGKDILGAAKTGSGKTLAFLVPVLEKLHHAQWTEYDGLGALIISPTRELAIQIFEVLRKIGRKQQFSAGLVIGGKSLQEEADRLARMNILVCTPGRILQHLDQTAGLDVNNLQILVLDEADRIMDMGFQSAVDALIEHLPRTRQTLMFSATQSKRVSDLARLSLKEPEYVSVHQDAETTTPTNLQQSYIVTPLPEKLETLWGFIRTNLKSKIIVFLSSTKQVRFVYESFKRMQPGMPLLHMIGRQKQGARLEIARRFTSSKYACLFATDVVARGMDFPAVDWVVQVDCPEDVATYIHRVGRTARYESKGRAVLFLEPSEEKGFLQRLEAKKIPINKVNVRENKKQSIKSELQNQCFQSPDVKYLAQKAFISYVRSIFLQPDKEVFKFSELDLDGFAASMGLPGTPQVKFQEGDDIRRDDTKNRSYANLSDSDSDEEGGAGKKKDEVRTKYQKMAERQNQDVLSSHYRKLLDDGEASDDDADFLSIKRVLDGDAELDAAAANNTGARPKTVKIGKTELVIDSKRREKMLGSKKQIAKLTGPGQRIIFDDDGVGKPLYVLKDEEQFKEEGPAKLLRKQFVEQEAVKVQEADVEDKELVRKRKKEKKERAKARERGEEVEREKGPLPQLGRDSEDEDEEDPLALLKSLPIAGGGGGGGSDREESGHGEEEDERPKKKAKKWFQNDSDVEDEKPKKKKKVEKSGKKVIEMGYEPDNLDDLEALAAGLLED